MPQVRLAISHGAAARGRDQRSASADDNVLRSIATLQFGGATVHYATLDEWAGFSTSAARSGLDFDERSEPIELTRLHVVIQKGRLFQQEHPEVPVLLDKGRFLLVELDPRKARRLNRSHVPCFALRPLRAVGASAVVANHRVVFATAEPHVGRSALRASDVIQSTVNKIARADFEADLRHLAGLRARHSTGADYLAACRFVVQQLTALGYQVREQEIVVNGRPSRNVIAFRGGAAPSNRAVVVVSAHLDSINSAGGPSSAAPGADDDASGSAGVIEIARALRHNRSAHDLQLVLFGGEEQGLLGSKQFVAALSPADRARTQAVVQMDMIGSLNTPKPSVLLEGAPLSRPVIDGLATAAATYTALAVQTSLNPHNSDHVSFLQKGIPAVLTIEGTDDANSAIHTERDTVDLIDVPFALEILRMITAYVAGLLELAPAEN